MERDPVPEMADPEVRDELGVFLDAPPVTRQEQLVLADSAGDRAKGPRFSHDVDPTDLFPADQAGNVRTALWVLALAVDYGGIMAIGSRGWEIFSATHWA